MYEGSNISSSKHDELLSATAAAHIHMSWRKDILAAIVIGWEITRSKSQKIKSLIQSPDKGFSFPGPNQNSIARLTSSTRKNRRLYFNNYHPFRFGMTKCFLDVKVPSKSSSVLLRYNTSYNLHVSFVCLTV